MNEVPALMELILENGRKIQKIYKSIKKKISDSGKCY